MQTNSDSSFTSGDTGYGTYQEPAGIVTAVHVSRRFGEGEAAVEALRDVSVGFPAGRFAAIMGPSGSGKSTLMHILAGLDRPTSGTVSIDGVELTHLDDGQLTRLRRDKVGFIFQTFNLLPVSERRGEHPVAALDRGPEPRPGVVRSFDRHGRDPRPA